MVGMYFASNSSEPDEEWEGISAYRYCWLYPKITDNSGKHLCNFQQVAAFRATLEEITESLILVHVVDISQPLAEQQIEAVEKVLSELDTSSIPKLMLWNKADKAGDPDKIKLEAKKRNNVVCVSALTGEGLDEFCSEIQNRLKDAMVWVEALIPFDKGELLSTIHQVGMVERTEYTEKGTLVRAHVPLRFARLLTPMGQMCV